MSKKKRKLKRLLKNVAMAGAIGLGARALANKRRNESIADNEAKEFGFGQMKMKDFGPYSSKVMNAANNRNKNILANPDINKMDTSEVDIPDNYFKVPVKKVRPNITYGSRVDDGLSYGLKSGGRVVKTGEKVAKRKKKKSIQIKGFGKARRG